MPDGHDWHWEYDPGAAHVIGGLDDLPSSPGSRSGAEELVRAAAALYLDGTTYQGASSALGREVVTGGMFVFQTVPRHRRVCVLQVTVL
ncbi:hypothetical protein [Streptomyces sp. UNOC14_S4]|uniref:hypothetical protein n=1 Tax=Streptomyces sp. UNOC14_S4 TaxID=2872340 RepID=UPI001E2F5E53|nr:hypothetical protein [Streptomyces sp. UNOC14_S4]MCC3767542.1 hypothetical protein [Streptomyces sp. UNOC14_S4]